MPGVSAPPPCCSRLRIPQSRREHLPHLPPHPLIAAWLPHNSANSMQGLRCGPLGLISQQGPGSCLEVRLAWILPSDGRISKFARCQPRPSNPHPQPKYLWLTRQAKAPQLDGYRMHRSDCYLGYRRMLLTPHTDVRPSRSRSPRRFREGWQPPPLPPGCRALPLPLVERSFWR